LADRISSQHRIERVIRKSLTKEEKAWVAGWFRLIAGIGVIGVDIVSGIFGIIGFQAGTPSIFGISLPTAITSTMTGTALAYSGWSQIPVDKQEGVKA
jgi:hypothetical protein